MKEMNDELTRLKKMKEKFDIAWLVLIGITLLSIAFIYPILIMWCEGNGITIVTICFALYIGVAFILMRFSSEIKRVIKELEKKNKKIT